MSDFVNVTRAELFKLVRRPAAWTLMGASLVLTTTFGYLVPYLSYRSAGETGGPVEGASKAELLASTMPDQIVANAIGGFPVFAGALALSFGALMFGGEYGWGTVKTLMTQRPRRLTLLGGQVMAMTVAVTVTVLAVFAVGVVCSTAIANVEGQSIKWPGAVDLMQGLGVGTLILTMWASLGAALGVSLRSVALPIGFGVVWVLGIENLLSAVAGTVLSAVEPLRDVLPGVNAGSLASSVMTGRMIEPPPGVTSSVEPTRALITVAAYVAVCMALAAWNFRRRDIA